MTPNALLKAFFEKLNHAEMGIPWDGLGEREIAPLLHAISQLTSSEQDEVELALHSVFNLACDDGINAMIEAALRAGDPDFAQTMPQEVGPYDKAMWTFLNHPEIFESASRIHHVDGLSWWRKRSDLPKHDGQLPAERIPALAEEVRQLLGESLGRVKNCTIEPLHRVDGTECFFCNPDDHVRTITEHDPHGHLQPKSIRATFPVVFAYNGKEGTLELYAKIPGKLKPKLEAAFARTMLGVELGVWKPDAVYRLNHLKDPMFELLVDPEDGVRARITAMRLCCRNSDREITIRIDGDTDEIQLALSQLLSDQYTSLAEMDVSLATFNFEFDAVDGRKPGSATFDVAFPSSCGLRNQRPERIALIQKYLKRWNVDCSGALAQDLSEAGL